MYFELESFEECVEEIKPLIDAHYSEVEFYQDKVKLSVNYELLAQLDKLDMLYMFIMRNDEGKLVGYNVFSVAKAVHYKDHYYATNYTVYIDPEYRHTHHTVDFFNYCEKFLKEDDVSIVHYQMKTNKTFSTLMNNLGYENTEAVYTKYVGQ